MSIDSFSSLIELTAGLNIALVIVEKTRGYTSILAKKIFCIHDYVETLMADSHIHLQEYNSLKEIKDLNINGENVMVAVEGCKRECEKLQSSLKQKKSDIFKNINSRCEVRSFSGISLFSFLFCISLLFFLGFSSLKDEAEYSFIYDISEYTTFFLGVLSFLFFCVGYFYIIKKDENILFLSSLKHVIFIFVIIFVLAIILGVVFKNIIDIEPLKIYYIPILTVIPLSNFVIFFFLIKRKSITIKKDIKTDTSEVVDSCAKWYETASGIITTHKTSISLTSETKQHQTVEKINIE